MMHSEEHPELLLRNQLCFPLYACARAVTGAYKPYLDEIDLTYTQYLTMLVLWEHDSLTSREIGRLLYLDSGTLTPLLKKLETKGLVKRLRSREDERNLIVELTENGRKLKEKAAGIPAKVGLCLPLEKNEATQLYVILYKLLQNLQ